LDKKIISDQDNIKELFKSLKGKSEKAAPSEVKKLRSDQEIVDEIVEQQKKMLADLQSNS